ncbi:hypothetical protein [Nocardia sp. CS682]|uniref:hypothetical protein n=1 Tax=Nocardia sp. CS682 TaxID=1047172 RepID=UPI001074EF9C|nr:hypothetical protein [Nocardia sp. CS682]QBS43574.1 hypothetical protein DMB37_29185 [Nocardia sp. CS682]
MTPDAAAALADRLTAAADSLADTAQAANYRAKATELRREYQITESTAATSTPDTASTKARTNFHEGKPRMTVKTAGPRVARRSRATAKTMHAAMNPKIKPAFAGSDPIGTEVSGFIIRIEEEQEKDWVTKKPAFDRRTGAPMMVPVLILQTDGTTRRVGPGLRKLWMRSGIRDAILEAILDVGAREPAVDAFLRISFSSVGAPANVNFRPPKYYTATYTPPETCGTTAEPIATQSSTTGEGE